MYANILCPVDLSDQHSWEKALPTAVELAKTFGATLHVMTVVPSFGLPMIGQFFPEGFEARMRAEAGKHLEEFCAARLPQDLPAHRIVAEGKIYQEILRAAASIEADLIVMGSHRPELSDYLLGPNAARVVRHAPCSVMVVRE
jgi:nucleotide-binding universal stress UspA family protein